MSTPAELIAKTRTQIHADSTNYSDDAGIIDLNYAYQDFLLDITSQLDEGYFWEIAKEDTAQNQNEYNITAMSDGTSINKIDKVFIKYSADDQYYTRAKYVNPMLLEYDQDWYWVNTSVTQPFYYTQDRSIFIFPTPTEAVTNWIKANLILHPKDLTKTGLETDIKIPQQFHRILQLGMEWKANESRLGVSHPDTLNSRNIYADEKMKALKQLRARTQDVLQQTDWLNPNQYC